MITAEHNAIIEIAKDFDMQFATGAMVSFRSFRKHAISRGVDNSRFNQLVMDLFFADKIDLHTHDNVGQLSQEEVDELVCNDYGQH